MATVVAPGDRLILAGGSLSSLKRSSVPFSMWSPSGSSVNLSGGVTASYQQVYESELWLAKCIDKLTRATAVLPLNVYRLTGDGESGERERVRDHDLVRLLHRPQPRRGQLWFKTKLMFPALLHGNAVVAKMVERAGEPPSGFLPLDWRYLSPHFVPGTEEVEFWETTQSGSKQYLAPGSVLHMAWEAGRGDMGVAPLSALASTLSVENGAMRYQASSFENGVRYSSVYILPPDVDITEQERAELRTAIQAQQGGVDKAFGMALVSGGGDIKTLQQTAVEAALIDQRKLNREEIAAAFDIPPPLIGILDKATYSNIEVQMKSFYGPVLGPWLALIKETIQSQLIDMWQPWRDERLFVDFDLSDVLKGEPLAEVQAIAAAIGTGIMTPNEGREARNLPPSDDPEASKLHMPTNNMTAMGGEPPAAADVVKAHVKRATDRLRDKGDPDIERFVRELSADTSPEIAADALTQLEALTA